MFPDGFNPRCTYREEHCIFFDEKNRSFRIIGSLLQSMALMLSDLLIFRISSWSCNRDIIKMESLY